MRVLVFTNMYPCDEDPSYGVFVREQVEGLRREGIEVDVLFINGRRSRLNYLKGVVRFLVRCRSDYYDLIHAHHTYCAAIARLQSRYPVILTLHEGEILHSISVLKRLKDYGFWKIPIFSRQLKRLMSKRVRKVITVSSEIARELGLERTETLSCGIDLEKFKPMPQGESRLKIGLPVGDRTVLFPASPSRRGKRYDIVSKAMELVKRRVPDLRLITLGGVSPQLVPTYMNACDALVFTSEYEASPMVIKEALAVNLPLVTTDVGDARELIGDTDGCFICDGSPQDVACYLEKAVKFGRKTKGRERIRTLGLGLEQVTQDMVRIYQKVLGRNQ